MATATPATQIIAVDDLSEVAEIRVDRWGIPHLKAESEPDLFFLQGFNAARDTGGGSDGNFTAALGVPTLDGLGANGAGAHTLQECIFADSVAVRTALLANLMLTHAPA